MSECVCGVSVSRFIVTALVCSTYMHLFVLVKSLVGILCNYYSNHSEFKLECY